MAKEEIDYARVFSVLPEFLGFEMQKSGYRWIAGRKFDGTISTRRDKLTCRLLSNGIQMLEQGGSCITLFDWMLQYGGYKENVDVVRALLACASRVPAQKSVAEPVKKVELRYVERERLDQSYENRLQRPDNLTKYLHELFGYEKAESVLRRYMVGEVSRSVKERMTQFWYIDRNMNICHDKLMLYREDGHRNKYVRLSTDRTYRVYRGYTGRCYFGEHLLKHNPDEQVYVVESEKTALICAMFYGTGIWLATGAKVNLRNVEPSWRILPDYDAFDEWSAKYPGQCIRWWEKYTEYEVHAKDDIADMLIWKTNGGKRG